MIYCVYLSLNKRGYSITIILINFSSKFFFLPFKRKSLNAVLLPFFFIIVFDEHEKSLWKLIERKLSNISISFKQKFYDFNFVNFPTDIFFFFFGLSKVSRHKRNIAQAIYIYFFVRHRTKLFLLLKENPETILYNGNYFQFRKWRICVTPAIYSR